MLTCKNCLAGKTYKCEGSTCARWVREHADTRPTRKNVRAKIETAPKTYKSTFSAEQRHAVARMLIEGVLTSDEISRVMHCSYARVRQVFSELRVLASRVTRV